MTCHAHAERPKSKPMATPKWARLRLTVVKCNLAARELLQRAWPPILVMLALVVTLAWVAFLGHLLMEAAHAL